MLNRWAYQPGEKQDGGCLPFALAYCATHPGSQLILVTWALRNGKLSCHAFVEDHGTVSDNMHPDCLTVWGKDPLGWAGRLGYNTRGLHLFRSIDFDHQTAEDKHVIEVLKKTVRS